MMEKAWSSNNKQKMKASMLKGVGAFLYAQVVQFLVDSMDYWFYNKERNC